MAQLARGDRSAFEPLYRALQPRATRLARRRVGEAAASDVGQAALLRVFSRASEFVPGRPCRPWFYAIVANETRAIQRRDTKLVADDRAVDVAPSSLDDPEAQMMARELERALEAAIDALDADAAQAIHAVLGRGALPPLSPPTLRKRVSRAYAKLRLLLGGGDVG